MKVNFNRPIPCWSELEAILPGFKEVLSDTIFNLKMIGYEGVYLDNLGGSGILTLDITEGFRGELARLYCDKKNKRVRIKFVLDKTRYIVSTTEELNVVLKDWVKNKEVK